MYVFHNVCHNCTTDAIIPSFAKQGFAIAHYSHFCVGSYGATFEYAHFTSHFFTVCTNVYVHFFFRHHLGTFFRRKNVRRFTANHAYQVIFFTVYSNALAEHYLLPPTTKTGKFEETVFSNVFNHKADFVHMTSKHYFRSVFFLSSFSENYTAQFIIANFCHTFQTFKHQILHSRFEARNATGFRVAFEPS